MYINKLSLFSTSQFDIETHRKLLLEINITKHNYEKLNIDYSSDSE
jgi:hypothetical protein